MMMARHRVGLPFVRMQGLSGVSIVNLPTAKAGGFREELRNSCNAAHSMPSKRVLTAALTSQSCLAPQPQLHCLTESIFNPLGPDNEPHDEHVFVEFLPETSIYRVPPARHLYAI